MKTTFKTSVSHEPSARFPFKAKVNGVIFSHCQTQNDAEGEAVRAIHAIENFQALQQAETLLRKLRRTDFDLEGRGDAIDKAKQEVLSRRHAFPGVDAYAFLQAISARSK